MKRKNPWTKNKKLVIPITTTLITAAILTYRISRMRNEPSPLPYSQRMFTEFPRPFMSRTRLHMMLQPVAGQRLLEIGPGTGYYSLDATAWISPGGTLDILDVEQRMLDHTIRKVHEFGLDNVFSTQGDAQELPYPANSFDAAFLVATLGEIPDQERVLKELHRVLKPNAHLVIGEGQPDPHMVGYQRLRRLVQDKGFTLEGKTGNFWGYFAKFKVL
ncbi:class I SAM-dependent methyltransferase [Halobacillus naozhouensis]|uniref:Class I SAM-dependent methyltransferase n=1 Tax=Halobacillus naozhouensis TaxID=554880 RepID=A0ABY8J1U8_9BACI|nr:methyltransferase domain-containing protein [Halobacillus naozhouensis]WFT76468.1 class I SAM-dependent methyltransferase [Halobacillus naozhouensis]